MSRVITLNSRHGGRLGVADVSIVRVRKAPKWLSVVIVKVDFAIATSDGVTQEIQMTVAEIAQQKEFRLGELKLSEKAGLNAWRS